MSQTGDAANLKSIRLLLVDDEERFRTTLSKRLAEKGLTAETAGNGIDALKIVKDRPLDVIVLDIRMPEMDGIETLRQVKKIDAEVEIILLTGHANIESAVEGMRLGAYDYLMKPCDLEQLLEKITEDWTAKRDREKKAVRNGMQEKMDYWQKHWSRSS